MPRVLIALLLTLALFAVTPMAQTLSSQVLLLLSRANTWTALQTFDDVTITGTCTGCGGAGGGTVTSVAQTVPSILSVSGSPIVGSGTLAITLATQADNTVFSGPASGGPLTPTFRLLGDSDIPDTITIAGTNNVTWGSVNKTGSSLADLATRSASDLSTGSLALARLTDNDTTADLPLVSGGAGGDPVYEALDLTSATAISGQLAAANFPVLTGDVTTAGGSLATTLSVTGVAAATYGSATQVGQFTVDAGGRITAASNVAITGNALLDGSAHTDTASGTATRGNILVGNASNLWSALTVGTSGQVLRSDGTDAAWSVDGTGLNIDVDNATAGTLALNRGGTAASLTAVAGGAVYSTGSALAITAAGSVGECLTSNGASAPTWGACATLASHNLLSATHGDTAASSAVRGSIIVGNSTPDWAALALGSNGTVLRSNGTDAVWSTDGSQLVQLNASNLGSGTVPLGRLSGITGTEISSSAEIPISAITVTGGTASEWNYGTTTWDPASVADTDVVSTTVTVTGVAVGDPCFAGLTTLTTDDLVISANVSAADTVQVVLSNLTGGPVDLASGTLAASCFAF